MYELAISGDLAVGYGMGTRRDNGRAPLRPAAWRRDGDRWLRSGGLPGSLPDYDSILQTSVVTSAGRPVLMGWTQWWAWGHPEITLPDFAVTAWYSDDRGATWRRATVETPPAVTTGACTSEQGCFDDMAAAFSVPDGSVGALLSSPSDFFAFGGPVLALASSDGTDWSVVGSPSGLDGAISVWGVRREDDRWWAYGDRIGPRGSPEPAIWASGASG